MKKITGFLLVFSIILCLCACGSNGSKSSGNQTDPGTNESTTSGDQIISGKVIQTSGLKLTEMGTVSTGLQFVEQGVLIKGDSGNMIVLDMNGNAHNSSAYEELEAVLAEGICVVSKDFLQGVVNGSTGEELIPCEAVRIRILSDRYLLVCYETGNGSKNDSFDSYSKNGQTVYYKGYGQIYDLQKERFVPDVRETENPYLAYATSELVFLKDSDTRVLTVYDENGKIQGTYDHLQVFSESDLVLEPVSGGWRLYDGSMKQVSTIEGNIDATLPGTGEYLLRYEDKNGYVAMRILDLRGNSVCEELFADIEYLEPGYFVCAVLNGHDVIGYQICDLYGRFLTKAPVKEKFPNSPVFYSTESEDRLLILQNGTFYEIQDSVTPLCLTLILDGTRIVDLLSGEIVMEGVKQAYFAGNNLYVFDFEQQAYIRYLVEYTN